MNPQNIECVAEIEVSYRPAISNKPIIKSSLDAYHILKEFAPLDTIAFQEHFNVLYLNRASRVIGVYRLSKGGITGTVADTRIILAVALKVAATAIILSHNHPSGNLKPSRFDEELTQRIKQAASFMEIAVSDHIIFIPEEGKYYSFADEAML